MQFFSHETSFSKQFSLVIYILTVLGLDTQRTCILGHLVLNFLDPPQIHWKFQDPLIKVKKKSDYRVHYTQNDRLKLTVSTQKLVLKNMHQFPRYWSKCVKIWGFGLAGEIPTHLYQYFRIQYIFFKTDFCVETVSSSRLFWV